MPKAPTYTQSLTAETTQAVSTGHAINELGGLAEGISQAGAGMTRYYEEASQARAQEALVNREVEVDKELSAYTKLNGHDAINGFEQAKAKITSLTTTASSGLTGRGKDLFDRSVKLRDAAAQRRLADHFDREHEKVMVDAYDKSQSLMATTALEDPESFGDSTELAVQNWEAEQQRRGLKPTPEERNAWAESTRGKLGEQAVKNMTATPGNAAQARAWYEKHAHTMDATSRASIERELARVEKVDARVGYAAWADTQTRKLLSEAPRNAQGQVDLAYVATALSNMVTTENLPPEQVDELRTRSAAMLGMVHGAEQARMDKLFNDAANMKIETNGAMTPALQDLASQLTPAQRVALENVQTLTHAEQVGPFLTDMMDAQTPEAVDRQVRDATRAYGQGIISKKDMDYITATADSRKHALGEKTSEAVASFNTLKPAIDGIILSAVGTDLKGDERRVRQAVLAAGALDAWKNWPNKSMDSENVRAFANHLTQTIRSSGGTVTGLEVAAWNANAGIANAVNDDMLKRITKQSKEAAADTIISPDAARRIKDNDPQTIGSVLQYLGQSAADVRSESAKTGKTTTEVLLDLRQRAEYDIAEAQRQPPTARANTNSDALVTMSQIGTPKQVQQLLTATKTRDTVAYQKTDLYRIAAGDADELAQQFGITTGSESERRLKAVDADIDRLMALKNKQFWEPAQPGSYLAVTLTKRMAQRDILKGLDLMR